MRLTKTPVTTVHKNGFFSGNIFGVIFIEI